MSGGLCVGNGGTVCGRAAVGGSSVERAPAGVGDGGVCFWDIFLSSLMFKLAVLLSVSSVMVLSS